MASEHFSAEIELYETSKEREAYENCADLYAIIMATEHLERVYARDAITHKEVGIEFVCDTCHLLMYTWNY